jgi:hypothetical protein
MVPPSGMRSVAIQFMLFVYTKTDPFFRACSLFCRNYLLIVLSLNLEVSLWVNTYWAYLRSLLAYLNVATV